MTLELENKTAVISGASRGIGRAIALEFAQRGANIVVNFARNEEAAKDTIQEIEKRGRKGCLVQGNIADPKVIDELMTTADETFGSIDILVHSAALGAFKPIHKLKVNQWDLSMDVNVKAFFLLSQKVLPYMERHRDGVILTISSLGAQRFIPNYGAIGISKAALENLVKYLAVEYAEKGIRVNCVSGGLVDTDALKSFPDYEGLKREALKRTPSKRIGTPQDIAHVAAFLASKESKWVVGQTIIADGGLSLIS